MAKASKTDVVIAPAVEAVVETRVTLELTFEEANVLAMIVGSVYGADSGTRALTSRIWKALRQDAGIEWDIALANKMTGTLTFTDE